MKSKLGLKKSVAVIGLLVGSFAFQVNAETGTLTSAFPLFSYNYPVINYLMGIINMPSSGVVTTNVPTNVIVDTNTTVVTNPGNANVDVTTANICAKYTTTFHKYGDYGTGVVKLQKFLNKYNGAHLNEKGFYGPATMQEVKNFQYAYGIKPTGAQYSKTTQAINSLNCGLIVKKDRVVYQGQAFVKNTSAVKVAAISPVVRVYPNAPIVKEVAPTGVVKTLPGKNSVAVRATSTNDFFSGIKSDFNKIKENYKAYALVLVLVLALFWFLRKAATE